VIVKDIATQQTVQDLEVQQTIEFVVKSHAGQFRKGTGLPYVSHCFGVMTQVADWDIFDRSIWKVSLCHDIFEECPEISPAELAQIIGEKECRIVEELTFRPVPPSNSSDPSVSQQKIDYMKSFASKSVEALVIKAADRICNTLDFLNTAPDYAPKYWKKADRLFEAVLSRHQEIIDRFGEASMPRIKYTRMTVMQMVIG
jgi:(p)ppGpp synthase/HD superfamily hydrolase